MSEVLSHWAQVLAICVRVLSVLLEPFLWRHRPAQGCRMIAIHSRTDLHATGLDDRTILRLERQGQLVRVRRGHYVWAREGIGELDVRGRHALACRAALLDRPEAVISHGSAATLWNLPVPSSAREEVHLTVPGARAGRVRAGVRVTRGQLQELDEDVLDALRVTTVPRTLVDLGRHESLRWTVAAVDDALHRQLCTLEEVLAALERSARVPGTVMARRAVLLGDARSESVGESLSRMMFIDAGLPPTELQKEFTWPGGRARVDFWWGAGVVGEFDGRVKYRGDAGDPAQVVWDEKRREDGLRSLGLIVVRWTWDEMWHTPEKVVARLRTALARVRAAA